MKKYYIKNSIFFVITKLLICYTVLIGNSAYSQDSIPAESSDIEKIRAIISSVDKPERQVGNFDPESNPSLPIGLVKEINGKKYIIAIDSAYFLNDKAYFSAYMAIDLPKSDKKIIFGAKNIQFNPKGVVGGDLAKLMLLNDQVIKLGPDTKLRFRGDGSNYVKWNCNGFESVNLKGDFLLSKRIVKPVSSMDTCVTATLEIHAEDVQDILVGVSVTPFTIKGLDDFEFTVSEAYVDMSDFNNLPGVILPPSFSEVYGGDMNLWRGFHLKEFSVKLPDAIGNGEERTTIYARDMFLDDAGVTGFFGATNVLSLNEGKTNGNWGLSVDLIEIGLTTNEITGGRMDGEVKVPLMKNNSLEYGAIVTKNEVREKADFLFTISTTDAVNIECFSSSLRIDETSQLDMAIVDGKFDPSLKLDGKWSLNRENGTFKGISFQDVTVIAESPFLSRGVFNLHSDTSAVKDEEGKMSTIAKFPISISRIALGLTGTYPTISVDAALNLGKAEDANNFTAAASMHVQCEVTQNEVTNKQDWTLKKFGIREIALDIKTTAFELEGVIAFKQDDPVYGDGFSGGLSLSIADVIDDISMYCMFGKFPDYKYWLVEASIPITIPITTNISITQLIGGLSYHVENTQTVDDIIAAARAGIEEPSIGLADYYVPNKDVGIGFKAGVGFKYGAEKVLNGELLFAIQFNSNGGLRDFMFRGDVYTMTTKAERATAKNYGKGTIVIAYDNVEKILDAQLAIRAEFVDAFTADIWAKFYISPSLWYFHLGTPLSPCSINLKDYASVSSYFMFGQNLPPMAPPPPQVSGVLGGMSDDRNEEDIVLGNGIGTGMKIQVGFDESLSLLDKYSVYMSAYVGTGFDMTLYKYAYPAHCEGEEGEFGANYWYLQGQLYAYGGFEAGVTGRFAGSDFNYTVISASMAMLLQGKLPKPAYIYGGINMRARIFSVINLDLTMEFDAGTECNIVY